MQRFSDFAEDPEILDGNKIRIDDVLNRELVVTGYSVKDSKYSKNKSGKYLTLQIRIDNDKRVIFTKSSRKAPGFIHGEYVNDSLNKRRWQFSVYPLGRLPMNPCKA